MLPRSMYEILANISEFGRESYRDTIVSIIEGFFHGVDKAQSCQYLVALILLYCPDKIKILEAKRVFERKHRFYTFSIIDPWPQEFTIDQLQEKILSAAILFTQRRTSLGESVQVTNLDSLPDDEYWQFDVNLCDQVKTTAAYSRKLREECLLLLPLIGHIIVRINRTRHEIEINTESITQARSFADMLGQKIWEDNRTHFSEKPIFDLTPIQRIGAEVVQVLNRDVFKIVVNMVEFWGEGEIYPTRFGKNSKTMDVTNALDRIKTCQKIEQIYFSATLNNNDHIKFGIKPPDKLDSLAAHRPFVYSLIEEMGLLA